MALRPSKPKTLTYNHSGPYAEARFELARVHEDWHAEQFAEPGDIQCTREVVLYDDLRLFDDMPYDEQAKHAEKIGNFLLKYAAWIKTRKQKEDPNAF